MAVGNVVTAATLNYRAGQLATTLRDTCYGIANLQAEVVTMGLAGLEAAGLSAADAQAMLNLVSYMNTIALIFSGQGTQGTQFNFGNAIVQLYGSD